MLPAALSGKKVLLGITGSIAAYKTIQLVRDLTASGCDVQVVLTRNARRFVPPLTLQVLSHRPVLSNLFESRSDVLHVTLAEGFDLIVVAPVTADFMAKMAAGLADDLLSALLLSVPASIPILLAPAMDFGMWDHPAVFKNVALLKERGSLFVDPESGSLASGKEGIGRMADPETILSRIQTLLSGDGSLECKARPPLSGEVVLVTAGPTREAIDPVRFLSNRSSGKMGYAVANLARQWGAKVIIISGPTALPPLDGIQTVYVESAAEMEREVAHHFSSATILIMAAAVSDYTISPLSQKLKRRGNPSLQLQPTNDILKGLKQKEGKVVVAFSAETENLYENAWSKLKEKGVDLIVANDVTQEGAGFDVDTNIVMLIDATGHCTSLPKMSKSDVARQILEAVIHLKGRRFRINQKIS